MGSVNISQYFTLTQLRRQSKSTIIETSEECVNSAKDHSCHVLRGISYLAFEESDLSSVRQ